MMLNVAFKPFVVESNSEEGKGHIWKCQSELTLDGPISDGKARLAYKKKVTELLCFLVENLYNFLTNPNFFRSQTVKPHSHQKIHST